jgi:hypothetical protein
MTPRAANSDMPIIALPSASAAPAASKSFALPAADGGRRMGAVHRRIAFGQPVMKRRATEVDGAWTITYLATTLFSQGRDHARAATAWRSFAAASGAWFVAQLIWDYGWRHISTPFPAPPICSICCSHHLCGRFDVLRRKPKGASIGPSW